MLQHRVCLRQQQCLCQLHCYPEEGIYAFLFNLTQRALSSMISIFWFDHPAWEQQWDFCDRGWLGHPDRHSVQTGIGSSCIKSRRKPLIPPQASTGFSFINPALARSTSHAQLRSDASRQRILCQSYSLPADRAETAWSDVKSTLETISMLSGLPGLAAIWS